MLRTMKRLMALSLGMALPVEAHLKISQGVLFFVRYLWCVLEISFDKAWILLLLFPKQVVKFEWREEVKKILLRNYLVLFPKLILNFLF